MDPNRVCSFVTIRLMTHTCSLSAKAFISSSKAYLSIVEYFAESERKTTTLLESINGQMGKITLENKFIYIFPATLQIVRIHELKYPRFTKTQFKNGFNRAKQENFYMAIDREVIFLVYVLKTSMYVS